MYVLCTKKKQNTYMTDKVTSYEPNFFFIALIMNVFPSIFSHTQKKIDYTKFSLEYGCLFVKYVNMLNNINIFS